MKLVNSFLIFKIIIEFINIVNKTKKISPAGNRTPVSRVTGGDTDHYTTEDLVFLFHRSIREQKKKK